MSRITELIKEKCSNGVEYRKLYEITNWDKRFNGVSQYMQTNILSYKHVSAELLKSLLQDNGNIKLLSTGLFDGYTTEELAKDLVNEGEVISIPSGGSANIKYYNGKFVDSGNILASSRDDELYNLKYIFYVLQSKNNVISDYFRGSGVKHPSMPDILKIDIPVPPIEVQEEIVRILDKFSSNGLESLLTLELELRREQYEYYLKRTFKSVSGKKVALGSVVTFNRGKRVVKKDLENDKTSNLFPVYQNSLIPLGYYDKSNFDCKKTIIISAGAAGKIGFVEEKIWAADDCLRCLCSNEILDKYLYYFLKSNESYIQSMVRRASVPRISANVFEKMEIIIPSIDIQRKIIEIFDRFEKIINNVNDGLPAEIELRRQQYEYYRNKLLSFEELRVSE